MKYGTFRLLLIVVGFAVVVGLPVLGKWARRNAAPRCASSGLPLEPLYQVRVVDASGRTLTFCCVHCAGTWLARQDRPVREILVTDEVSGELTDFRSAHFVESAIVTNSVTRNRIHVFRHRSDAENHAQAFGGLLLTDDDRPLRSE